MWKGTDESIALMAMMTERANIGVIDTTLISVSSPATTPDLTTQVFIANLGRSEQAHLQRAYDAISDEACSVFAAIVYGTW